ncbi:hypothetical protein PPL_00609 [Heterostelium album PN500]|uniref:Uncharacterized protein n=1 Tax=Heterostelium pallidum (strain ATCC 26659 / Pp 5 / PN500) TaxID=670386 RepID=D3AWY1_HETP5|nr:hypothetical protein PPL_00609 [Heterostelium album PN500]EFA86804.1 hypothetical protein PPL_00609 [Heterostelium album PN500]|eukprot:XP_020438907.1 hypothetical protein PPL_00609 [Heterostelium album PN500]
MLSSISKNIYRYSSSSSRTVNSSTLIRNNHVFKNSLVSQSISMNVVGGAVVGRCNYSKKNNDLENVNQMQEELKKMTQGMSVEEINAEIKKKEEQLRQQKNNNSQDKSSSTTDSDATDDASSKEAASDSKLRKEILVIGLCAVLAGVVFVRDYKRQSAATHDFNIAWDNLKTLVDKRDNLLKSKETLIANITDAVTRQNPSATPEQVKQQIEFILNNILVENKEITEVSLPSSSDQQKSKYGRI